MNPEYPASRDPVTRRIVSVPYRQRGHPIAFFLVLLALAAASFYAALAVVMRVDGLLFPGSSLDLPGGLARLPGLDTAAASQSTDRITILVLGLDRRPHHDPEEDGPPRSDSLYIVSLDPLTKSASVLAIPRDLYVEMPNPERRAGTWDTRINTAYHFGALYKYPGGGPALTRETVERTFKIEIDYYAVVDWLVFADVIDALGGIEITVPETLSDVGAINVRDGNAFPITIRAGRQPMDSITALAYSRYRDGPDGDFGRVRRQQQVMLAVMQKGLALGWLGRAPALYNTFRGAVETDLSPVKLPGMVALLRGIGLEQVQMISLAGEDGENVSPRITPYGEDVLIPVWENLGPALAEALPDRRLQEEQAVVQLINTVGTNGLATRSAGLLTRYGFLPGDILVGNGTGEKRRTTSITVYGDKEHTARRVAHVLDVPRSAIERRDASAKLPGEADVVVELGADIELPDDSRFDEFASR